MHAFHNQNEVRRKQMEYFKRRAAFEAALQAKYDSMLVDEGAQFDAFESTLKQEGYEIRRIDNA